MGDCRVCTTPIGTDDRRRVYCVRHQGGGWVERLENRRKTELDRWRAELLRQLIEARRTRDELWRFICLIDKYRDASFITWCDISATTDKDSCDGG
jgi:hypothetical protein